MISSVKLKPYISQIRGIAYKPNEISDTPFANTSPLLKANNITDDGLDNSSFVYIASNRIKPEQFIRAGDLLLAASSGSKKAIGKNVHFTKEFAGSFGAFCKVVRPKNGLHSDYLKHFFKTDYYRSSIEKAVQGANINNLKNEHLDDLDIPFPPIEDQIRIAHLLSKVERLITERKHHLQQLDDLLKSVFLEMFGDPILNEKGWDKSSFKSISYGMRNGLSPSKAGVEKGRVYTLSAITGSSFQEIYKEDTFSTIHKKYFPENNDFLVCRGNGNINLVGKGYFYPGNSEGIIFPDTIIAISININEVNKSFLEAFWKTRFVRQQIESNARTTNGAHKINQNVLEKLEIIKPPLTLQNQFATIVEKVESIKSRYQQSLTELEALYGALSQQAFKGELDLSRVPLPDQPVPPVTTRIHVAKPEEEAHAIHLPAPDNLPATLQNIEARNTLITQWLEVYLRQLSSTPFSVQDFMAMAQERLVELNPDNDIKLGASDYESIKKWVFKAIDAGRLKQTQNIAYYSENGSPVLGNAIELKAVSA